ncbi:hypothetical protein G7054_g5686 [Neopestalotiopsis clavispora]|nr:hypothetical protein G7054_g5686 [Neopestalotiopsis clavispora]
MIMQNIRIAILSTDVPVPNVRAKLGTYGDIFHRLISDAASRISPTTKIQSTEFDVVQGAYPGCLSHFDAILITGSAASAYDDVEWVRALDTYILDVYENHPRVKMFGSCFGHQIICRSLFKSLGVVVERDPKGWELGVHEIRFTDNFHAAMKSSLGSKTLTTDERPLTPDTEQNRTIERKDPISLKLQFVHADHVRLPHTEALPRPWMVIGSSEHCAVQGVYDQSRVLTFQGHFEFNRFINSETIKVFGASWEPARLEKALDDMDADDDALRAADIVMGFLLTDYQNGGIYESVKGLMTPPLEAS